MNTTAIIKESATLILRMQLYIPYETLLEHTWHVAGKIISCGLYEVLPKSSLNLNGVQKLAVVWTRGARCHSIYPL